MKNTDLFSFNGINGATGGYLTPKMSVAAISQVARGEKFDKNDLLELTHRLFYGKKKGYGFDGDPKDLSRTGWGVIFAFDDRDKIAAWKEALKPLLDLRKEQAGDLYKEYSGGAGFRPGDSKNVFLNRHKMGPGPVDPDKVPYYLLIVADPETVPYSFQFQLDVQFAVGRIYFDTLEEYANYAQSVVRAEKAHSPVLPKQLSSASIIMRIGLLNSVPQNLFNL